MTDYNFSFSRDLNHTEIELLKRIIESSDLDVIVSDIRVTNWRLLAKKEAMQMKAQGKPINPKALGITPRQLGINPRSDCSE